VELMNMKPKLRMQAEGYRSPIGGGSVSDYSGNGRDGVLDKIGSGSFALSTERPPVMRSSTAYALNLVENDNGNGARLRRLIPTDELDLSDHDWTFSGWFNRRDQDSDDFIFYIGRGDGFGANEELQLYCGGTAVQGSVAIRVFAPDETPLLTFPAFQGETMRMTVNGPAGFGYTVEASTNLSTWTPLQNFPDPALPFLWSDTDSSLHPRRFYRVRLMP
jgi:hypothetical protein